MTTETTSRLIGGAPINVYNIDGGAADNQFQRQAQNTANKGLANPPGINFVFSDFAFTLPMSSTGTLAITYDYDTIAQSIATILSTSPGERMMLPDFGCNVPSYVFEPCTALNARQLAADIRNALTTWENRISVNDVNVTPVIEKQTFYIDINYTLIVSGIQRSYSALIQTQPQ